MAKRNKKLGDATLIAENRKARFSYTLETRFECGIVLSGWEVKSARARQVQINESHIIIRKGEAWLLNAVFTPLMTASTHEATEPSRTRKLLLHRRELSKLIGAVEREGYTLVPLRMYWKKHRAKIEIAIAKGKKLHDKRATSKERDWQREKSRLLKNR